MQPEQLISREEVRAILFVLADSNVKLSRIVELLEEEDGEEEDPEDDT